jgi:cellulose synthase/poly-beta-1,6-N-acetylglucosamine synthase-like glycosyltransferase
METKEFTITDKEPTTCISVIIPARNEEANIGKLLLSIGRQTYPKHLFEVIVIDDHSTDNTAAVAKRFSFVNLISLPSDNINSYKKKAIETGIAVAAGDLIVTTDADCVVPENWLKTIAAFKEETQAVLIAAPVIIHTSGTFLSLFQCLDFMTLQGITAASVQKKIHSMSNGANLAYDRKAFYDVNGFSGIDGIASGDDMLLMEKIAKTFPGRLFYLLSKDAIVSTEAVSSWKEFFNQRIRWASKAKHYHDFKILIALFLVYFFNLSFPVLFVAGFFSHLLWFVLAVILLIKMTVELFFLYPVARFYKKPELLSWLPLFQPVHILYTITAGWLGLVGKFEWKGRRVN